MIYITGDTHGGFQRFGSKYFPQQTQMGRNDYMIICGDFGGLWDGGQKDQHWLDWLAEKPFTTLFVDGNHENFDLLNALTEKEWHGGRVHEVRENILHLMRGQIFTFSGLTWFTMGGASSHDIQDGVLDPEDPDFEQKYWLLRRMRGMFRVKGRSWWQLLSQTLPMPDLPCPDVLFPFPAPVLLQTEVPDLNEVRNPPVSVLLFFFPFLYNLQLYSY